jgi:hypothetical protein
MQQLTVIFKLFYFISISDEISQGSSFCGEMAGTVLKYQYRYMAANMLRKLRLCDIKFILK